MPKVRFIWWKDSIFGDEIEHERSFTPFANVSGLIWNGRRPDAYEIPKYPERMLVEPLLSRLKRAEEYWKAALA